MSNSNYPQRFEIVVAQLEHWRATTIAELRQPATREAALERKRQLDAAIACLKICERHQIRPDCQITVLPPTLTRTPSSEYRIVEDHESENREWWTEVEIDGEQFRPGEGDMIFTP